MFPFPATVQLLKVLYWLKLPKLLIPALPVPVPVPAPLLVTTQSLEYYSSHNTYNDCVVTNNGAGTGTGTGNAGINSFGNFNQNTTFKNSTVSGNGNVEF